MKMPGLNGEPESPPPAPLAGQVTPGPSTPDMLPVERLTKLAHDAGTTAEEFFSRDSKPSPGRDPVVGRFHCRACDVGQGITSDATMAQREQFERFCEVHEPHEAERRAALLSRATRVTGDR